MYNCKRYLMEIYNCNSRIQDDRCNLKISIKKISINCNFYTYIRKNFNGAPNLLCVHTYIWGSEFFFYNEVNINWEEFLFIFIN